MSESRGTSMSEREEDEKPQRLPAREVREEDERYVSFEPTLIDESELGEDTEPEEEGHSPSTLPMLAGLAVFTVLAISLYGSVLDLGFLGWDSFPLVWSSACESLGETVGLFRTVLMDGVYTDGSFYRPTTSLSFALNEATAGLDARGYHLFDMAVLVVSAVFLIGIGHRLALQPATIAGATAGLLFLLHPVQLTLLPVPPRRADALSLVLLLACLHWQRDEDQPTRAWPLGVGLLAFFCAGAKETGALVAVLVPLLHVCRRQRPVHVLLQTLPVAAGVGLYLLLRSQVLTGLAGHAESGLEGLERMPDLLQPYAELVLGASAHGWDESPRTSLFLGGSVAFGIAVLVALWRPGASRARERFQLRGSLVFVHLWLAAELAMASLAGRIHEWYAVQLVAPFVLLVGLLLATGLRLLRQSRIALLPLLLPAPFIVLLLLPLGSYRERSLRLWTEADELTKGLLEDAVQIVDATPIAAGAPGVALALPGWVPVLPAEGLATVALLDDYSIEAYLDLVRPEREVRVQRPGTAPEPTAGELVLVLEPARR